MNHELTFGVLLGCAAAAAANVGVVIEKLAMRRMPAFDARKTSEMVRRLIRNPVWVMGFSLIAASIVSQMLALSLASISVVQAVAPTGTVLLLVLSHILLGDRLRRAEYFGIGALLAALCLLLFSLDPRSDLATGSADLSALLVVSGVTICVSVLCFAVASQLQGSAEYRKKLKAPLYGLAAGLLYGCAALDTKSMSTLMQRWGVIAAIPQILSSPVFYMFLATATLAFLMFQMALQRSTTSVFVPVSSVLSTAYFMIVGDALFHEHLPAAPLSLSLRLASFALLAVGLLALTVVNEGQSAEGESDVAVLGADAATPVFTEPGRGRQQFDRDRAGFRLPVLIPEPLARSARAQADSKGRRGKSSGNPLPIGLSGSMGVRLTVFALVSVGTVLIAVFPFPHDAHREVSIAAVIFFVLVAAAFLVPWEKLPDWAWLVIPIGYIAVIAIIRDAQGGADSGLVAVFLLPIVWLALYGRRSHLLVGLFCLDLALLVPLLIVGPPRYPTLEWRQVVVMATVTTLIVLTVCTIVSRDRGVLTHLAGQSRIAWRNAREAHAARDRLETLLRAATGSAIMGVDQWGTITFFSAGAEQVLGYTAAEVIGIRSITDFIDPAQIEERRQTIESMRNALESLDAEAATEVPWTVTRRDGQQRCCVVRVSALPAAARTSGLEPWDEVDVEAPGTAPVAAERAELDDLLSPSKPGYVVVAIDVTEREELAADRDRFYAINKEVTRSLTEQNNRLRELTQIKEDVVATVSHELRTPVTSIRGFVELLLDTSSELSESQVRMLQTIERNAEQLQREADDLLADPGAGRGLKVAFTALDLAGLAKEAVDAMQISATMAGVMVTMEPCDEAVPIMGDRTRLHQLLGNLLSNAIKFSPRGGRVHVWVDTSGDYARIQVLDEGVGIPEGEREQLFERFYRLTSSTEMGVPGTGLGLAIVKSVAEAHEGFVDIVDTPGWSVAFRCFLPLHTSSCPAERNSIVGSGQQESS